MNIFKKGSNEHSKTAFFKSFDINPTDPGFAEANRRNQPHAPCLFSYIKTDMALQGDCVTGQTNKKNGVFMESVFLWGLATTICWNDEIYLKLLASK